MTVSTLGSTGLRVTLDFCNGQKLDDNNMIRFDDKEIRPRDQFLSALWPGSSDAYARYLHFGRVWLGQSDEQAIM